MKKLTLEIEDDGTFNARLSIDGVVVASASGNQSVCTVMGAVNEVSNVLRMISGQRWQRAMLDAEQLPVAWQAFYSPAHGNSFWLPNGTLIGGFESGVATISASARLKDMFPALIKPPEKLYQAFHTCEEGWGFFDRAGQLHATFPGQQDADAVAAIERAKVPQSNLTIRPAAGEGQPG